MSISFESSVAIVDPTGPVRHLVTTVFKDSGFVNTQALSSLKDALNLLEVERVDWLVLPLCLEDEINGLQFLKLVQTVPELRSTRISFFLEEAENEFKYTAFESGLLSCFVKPFNKESLTEDLSNFIKNMNRFNQSDCKTSIWYLAEFLIESAQYEQCLQTMNQALEVFPAEEFLMGYLAKCYAKMGKQEDAKSTLKQIEILTGAIPEELKELASEISLDKTDSPEEGSASETVKVLPLKNIALVIEDNKMSKDVEDWLTSLGVQEVKSFDNGEGAWIVLNGSEEPDLVILDWKIPKLPGPLLLQRMKDKFPSLPILVLCSGVSDQDGELLKEMGVTALMPREIEKKELIKNVIYCIQQKRKPSGLSSLENAIRQKLKNKKADEAVKLKEEYLAHPFCTGLRKNIILAEFAYYEEKYLEARDLALRAISEERETVILLNLIGKCLIKLDDYENAMKCFEKANELSPKNLERLCTMAIASKVAGNEGKAEENIGKAAELDGASEEVLGARSSMAIVGGDAEEARKIMEEMGSIKKIIAFMNNQAVVYAKSGQAKKSMDLYRDTIAAIPEKDSEMQALVTFNLAFAHLRSDEFEDAAQLFDKAAKLTNGHLAEKATRVLQSIRTGLEKGQAIKISKGATPKEINFQQEAAEAGSPKIIDHKEIKAKLSFQAGDLCCFKIYEGGGEQSERVIRLRDKPLHFNPRENIKREESYGLEKIDR